METVWITKHAISAGIEEVEVLSRDGKYVTVRRENYSNGWDLLGKGDWASTKEEAMRVAEEMRKKKLDSLRKQIDKLEIMSIIVKKLVN